MDIFELQEKFRAGDISVVDHTEHVLDEAKAISSEHNYFTHLDAGRALEIARQIDSRIKKDPSGKLLGVPISVKDAICIKGMPTRASSRILADYKPPFDATVITRILEQGGIPIGHTVQDEFGFGAFCVNVGLGFKIPTNPHDPTRTTGGSSGGSAGFTAKTSFAHVSLGESTGGSIVEPAAFCNVVGLCPTYGRVSRYGLLEFSSSMDKIGPMAKSMKEAAALLEVIAGHDTKESTTSTTPIDDYTSAAGKDVKGMKIGVIKEAFGEGVDPAVEKQVWGKIKELESLGATYQEISLVMPIKYGIPVYYLIGTSEASTNLAKYCGMRYGAQDKLDDAFKEYFTKVRSSNLGEEAKRRIMLGTFARMSGQRDAYYIKALKVRSKITAEYKKAFKKVDVLASPTAAILPPTFDEIKKLTPLQHYMIDIMTVGPNVAGLPHVSVPCKAGDEISAGLLLMADHFQESAIIQVGAAAQNAKGGAK